MIVSLIENCELKIENYYPQFVPTLLTYTDVFYKFCIFIISIY